MARSLGIETVAEGIETVRQHDRMRDMQCTFGQGFFYAQPLLPEALEASFRIEDAAPTVLPQAAMEPASKPSRAGSPALPARARPPRTLATVAATGRSR